MKFQIGAMTVGDIFDRGLKLLLARLPTFYAINLIVLSPFILMQLLFPLLLEGNPLMASLGMLVSVLLLLVLQQIGTGAILHVITQEFVDRRVGMSDAFNFALGRFGSLFGAAIIVGLTVGVGFILCLVPGIIFAIWYIFTPQVVVVEGVPATQAMGRSKSLTEGFRWRVFGVLGLIVLITIILHIPLALLQLVIPSTEKVPTGGAGPFGVPAFREVFIYRNYFINTLLEQLVNILAQTYQAVCLTLMYFDLRIRKEGFDLELAARQQGEKAAP